MSRFKVLISTMAGDSASNRISVGRPRDAWHAERWREHLDDVDWGVTMKGCPSALALLFFCLIFFLCELHTIVERGNF